ncbi:hypothetical protein EON79_11380 [bacterium]|nr:MAG: hypothetical protein EON79_11380 [bacterium]
MSSLAIATVSLILLAGMSTLVTSYSIRQSQEAEYARALQLAEAGVNFELHHITAHLDDDEPAHVRSNPASGSVPGVAGRFNVHVTNPDGSLDWTLPGDLTVVSTGTVGGISRTVTVQSRMTMGGDASVFSGNYAVYGTKRVLFLNSKNTVVGNLGANGPARASEYSVDVLNGGGVNASYQPKPGDPPRKPLTLAGGANLVTSNAITLDHKTGDADKIHVVADSLPWPTVDTLVQQRFGGYHWLLQTVGILTQGLRMRKFLLPILDEPSPLTTIPAVTGTASLTYLNNATLRTLFLVSNPLLSRNAIILTPGDYYFTQVDLDQAGFTAAQRPELILDTAAKSLLAGKPGPVRIWIGGGLDLFPANDNLKLKVTYTSGSDSDYALRSRIYYNKSKTLTLGGTGHVFGVYAVRGRRSESRAARVVLDANMSMTGSVIGDFVTMNGAATVTYPGARMADPDDPPMGPEAYTFSSDWREILWRDPHDPSVTRGKAIFTDGTSR